MARIPLPSPETAIVALPTPAYVAKDWHDYFRLVGSTLAEVEAAVAATTEQTDFISGIIAAPTNKDYYIVERIPYAATLTKFYARTTSGTVTAALKIDPAPPGSPVAVTGGSISVSSTQGSSTPSAANVLAAGDGLVVTMTSASSPVDLSFVIEFTRTV